MAGVTFDGKTFAEGIISGLPKSAKKLAVIVDPGNAASLTYTKMKQRVAEKVGVQFEICDLKFEINFSISQLINDLNKDETVDGIMIQMPFADSSELVKLIDPTKDVDGLRDDSLYKPAVVRAVMEVLQFSIFNFQFSINSQISNDKYKICVVGSKGFVGSRLMKEIPGAVGMDKEDFDSEKLRSADVVISATGQAGLIKPEMVKEGVIAIDVGYPKGDFDPRVAQKAAFFTPVPGGVGPVTVAMLFKNLLEG